MTKDEALRLALEALKSCNGLPHWPAFIPVTDAIKAALEAKDEPVAWMYEVNHAHTCLDLFEPPDDAYDEGTLYPLYTTPPQRKPLTDEAIATVYWGATGQSLRPQDNLLAHNFARAIEAAHGIKGEP